MTDLEKATTTDIRHSSFGINSSSVIRHSSLQSAFTLIELIVVFGIILVLSGLILSTAGYARKKAARTRAETEIAAMSAAIENYKADKGVYPTDANARRGRYNSDYG